MSDFSKTKKGQKNQNRQVSFFVKYMFLLSNQSDIKHFSKSMHIDVFLALYENIRICILLLIFFIVPPYFSLENCKRVQGFLDLKCSQRNHWGSSNKCKFKGNGGIMFLCIAN